MAKGNHTGAKWTKGGALGRNRLSLELSGFDEIITKLDELYEDVRPILTEAMENAAEMVEYDTEAAVKKAHLPAHGRYSTGDTEKSIVRNAKVEWSGTVGEIGIGFDKTKKGAGGFLITGTPRMRPDWELERMYTQKKYKREVQETISDVLFNAMDEAMEGRG